MVTYKWKNGEFVNPEEKRRSVKLLMKLARHIHKDTAKYNKCLEKGKKLTLKQKAVLVWMKLRGKSRKETKSRFRRWNMIREMEKDFLSNNKIKPNHESMPLSPTA